MQNLGPTLDLKNQNLHFNKMNGTAGQESTQLIQEKGAWQG